MTPDSDPIMTELCLCARPMAGLKSLFHKLETYGDQCLQIPVFTGMTGFGAVLRVDGKNDIANRRAVYGPTLERRLLKQAPETRHYIRLTEA